MCFICVSGDTPGELNDFVHFCCKCLHFEFCFFIKLCLSLHPQQSSMVLRFETSYYFSCFTGHMFFKGLSTLTRTNLNVFLLNTTVRWYQRSGMPVNCLGSIENIAFPVQDIFLFFLFLEVLTFDSRLSIMLFRSISTSFSIMPSSYLRQGMVELFMLSTHLLGHPYTLHVVSKPFPDISRQ